MRLDAAARLTNLLRAGGPGSGCQGPNCGRKPGDGESVAGPKNKFGTLPSSPFVPQQDHDIATKHGYVDIGQGRYKNPSGRVLNIYPDRKMAYPEGGFQVRGTDGYMIPQRPDEVSDLDKHLSRLDTMDPKNDAGEWLHRRVGGEPVPEEKDKFGAFTK